MTRPKLEEIGRALFGDQWQVPLARELEVADRTVRRWAAGDVTPPAGVRLDLARICREHAVKLARLADRLDREA